MNNPIDTRALALAHRMADASGEILRKAFRQPVSVMEKADTSPVTETDRAVEIAMRALIEAEFPDHGIIGEEFGNVRESSPYQWVLDPIDGTRSFIAGYSLFTTLIALAYEGVPILGVIDQPILHERWVGRAGTKTTLNGSAISTHNCVRLADAVIATTSAPDYFSAEENAAFDCVRNQCAQTIVGGDGYGYAMLATGQIELFIDTGLKPYDFCAHKAVIEGAGGVITDWEGYPLTIKSDGKIIAAACWELHENALELLQAGF